MWGQHQLQSSPIISINDAFIGRDGSFGQKTVSEKKRAVLTQNRRNAILVLNCAIYVYALDCALEFNVECSSKWLQRVSMKVALSWAETFSE